MTILICRSNCSLIQTSFKSNLTWEEYSSVMQIPLWSVSPKSFCPSTVVSQPAGRDFSRSIAPFTGVT